MQMSSRHDKTLPTLRSKEGKSAIHDPHPDSTRSPTRFQCSGSESRAEKSRRRGVAANSAANPSLGPRAFAVAVAAREGKNWDKVMSWGNKKRESKRIRELTES